MLKVAALVPYQAGYCPGQRFRIEAWARLLGPRGVAVEFFPFSRAELTDVLYRPGARLRKAGGMLRCLAGQLRRVASGGRADVIYIYQGASLIGPALVERMARRRGVPIVYDIDEPVFLPPAITRNGAFSRLKCPGKTYAILRMSDRVLAVNRAIADHVAPFSRRVTIVPMAVDLDHYRPEAPGSPPRPGAPLIGWVGSRTAQPNLDAIAGPLGRLRETHGARLRVIADDPEALPGVVDEFIPWAPEVEVPRLRECAVGVVPLRDNTWAPWKFNFKLLQYMSLGLPVVASRAGSNVEVIRDGHDGFLAGTDDEWYGRLRLLLEDPALRARMGREARRTVEARFGLDRQVDFMEGVFRGLARERRPGPIGGRDDG